MRFRLNRKRIFVFKEKKILRDNERKREKEGRLFVKRLSQKLSAASRKTGDKANISRHKPKPVITPFHNLPHSNTAHKTRECATVFLHKSNAAIKFQRGGAPVRSRRGQGDGVSPLGSKLSDSLSSHSGSSAATVVTSAGRVSGTISISCVTGSSPSLSGMRRLPIAT